MMEMTNGKFEVLTGVKFRLQLCGLRNCVVMFAVLSSLVGDGSLSNHLYFREKVAEEGILALEGRGNTRVEQTT
jgi:hypothetical protein